MNHNSESDLDQREDLLESAPCALAVLSMDGTIEWSNAAFQSISGLRGSGLSFFGALTRGGTIFYETQLLPVILLRGSIKEVALDLVRNDGNSVAVFLSANLRRAGNRTPAGIRIALFEATERQLYERDLLDARKSAEQLADVVRRALDAIVTLSPEGRVLAWNSGAEQTFGYLAEEASGRLLTELVFPQDLHHDIRNAVRQLHAGNDVSLEIEGIHRDGRSLDLSLRLTPHLEPPGVLVAFSAIIRDITSRRAAEQALVQSEKLASVGRLASSIAHEINNPLEAVTNLLFLLNNIVPDGEARNYLRMAQEELSRVSQIVIHTLRFHKQSTKRTQANIQDVLRSVLTVYQARLHNSDIEVTLRSSEATLFCFEGEIRQIVLNLFSNAYDAVRPEQGRIELRCRNATSYSTGISGVRITIADNGPGIEESVRKRLFQPFVSTKGITGTGLGLWITQDLVRKNDGTVRIRTCTVGHGRGTVFSLHFPHRSQLLSDG